MQTLVEHIGKPARERAQAPVAIELHSASYVLLGSTEAPVLGITRRSLGLSGDAFPGLTNGDMEFLRLVDRDEEGNEVERWRTTMWPVLDSVWEARARASYPVLRVVCVEEPWSRLRPAREDGPGASERLTAIYLGHDVLLQSPSGASVESLVADFVVASSLSDPDAPLAPEIAGTYGRQLNDFGLFDDAEDAKRLAAEWFEHAARFPHSETRRSPPREVLVRRLWWVTHHHGESSRGTDLWTPRFAAAGAAP